MLKNIDPLLNADVLYALRAMGHGDDLIIADTNFPSDAVARDTVLGELLRIDAPAARVARAVLSVMPLDTFVDDAATRMEVVGAPDEIPDVQREVQAEIDAAEGREWPMIVDRALLVLRPRAAGLCRHPDARAAVLRLLRVPQGRDRPGGLRWAAS